MTRKFPRLNTISQGFNHQWQADLVDYGFGKWMILVVIDLFSRQEDAEITRSKNASSILRAFKKIVERRGKPMLSQRADGREFFNKQFSDYKSA